MNLVSLTHDVIGLRTALRLCGVSKKAWYYKPKPREIPLDPVIKKTVEKISLKRPSYGTRRMAAQVSRELNRPVNRKAIRRVFTKLGWNTPSRTKKEIIRVHHKVPRPEAPNELWESDMTYIWCGVDGWGYCFNVIDVFTRQWISFVLADRATRNHAIMAVNNAVATAKPNTKNLRLRVDNGSQYTSRDFRASVSALGISLEYIYVNTPEQNGHVESLHKTIKKEYIWPNEIKNLNDAQKIIQEAFEDYNHHRIHSSLEYLTPSEYIELWESGKIQYKNKQLDGGEKCE